jgi:predicted Zn-dependent protease
MTEIMRAKLIVHLFSLVLISSCSHMSWFKGQEEKEAQLISSNEQQKENFEQASEQLKKLIASAKASDENAINFLASDLFLKAHTAQIHGDYTTANFLYEHLMELKPNETLLQKKYAVSLIKGGELSKAEGLLAKVYKNNPKEEKIGLILAGVKSGLGEVKEAKKIYKKVLKAQSKEQRSLPVSKQGLCYRGRL